MKLVFAILVLLISSTVYSVQSIVVLPFSNESKKQELYWLGEGFAESLSEEMLFKDGYFIDRPERKAAYDELRLPYVGDLSRATMLRLGQKLAADYVVFGSYTLEGTNLHLQAQVIKRANSKLSHVIQAQANLDRLYDVQNQLKEGLKKYFAAERLPAVDPKDPDAKSVSLHAYELYIKGLLEASDAEKIKFFQRALQTQPNYRQAVYRMALALFRLQRYKESIDALKMISNAGALQDKVEFLIGLNYFQLRDYPAAKQKWFELSRTSGTAEVFNNLGLAMVKKDDAKNAVWYLDKATKLDSENANYEFNLASCYLLLKQDEQALHHYRQAIGLLPNDYQAFYLIGKILERQGNPQTARINQFFQETIPTDQKGKFPEQSKGALELLRPAMSYLSLEERAYKLRPREKWSVERQTYVKTYQSGARKRLEEKDPEKAILEIKKGISLSPFDWYLYYLLGFAHRQQENLTAAVQDLQFSLWCLENVDSHLLLAEIYRDAEQYDTARLHVQKSLGLDPKNKKATEIWNKIWNKK